MLGACACKKPNGLSCAKAEECISNFCIDGFCCESACDSSCRSCAEAEFEGRCTLRGSSDKPEKPLNPWPITGNDMDGGMGGGGGAGGGSLLGFRPACLGDDACGGFCDGQSNDCQYPPEGSDCGLASCIDGVAESQSCQEHFCKSDPSKDCFPSICDNGESADAGDDAGDDAGIPKPACKDSCASHDHCHIDGFCDMDVGKCKPLTGPRCDGDHTVRRPNAPHIDCTPIRCEGSACLPGCKSHLDCVEGKVCKMNGLDLGECIDLPPPPPLPTWDPSCGCIAAGASPDERSGPTWLLGLMVLAMRRLGIGSRFWAKTRRFSWKQA